MHIQNMDFPLFFFFNSLTAVWQNIQITQNFKVISMFATTVKPAWKGHCLCWEKMVFLRRCFCQKGPLRIDSNGIIQGWKKVFREQSFRGWGGDSKQVFLYCHSAKIHKIRQDAVCCACAAFHQMAVPDNNVYSWMLQQVAVDNLSGLWPL